MLFFIVFSRSFVPFLFGIKNHIKTFPKSNQSCLIRFLIDQNDLIFSTGISIPSDYKYQLSISESYRTQAFPPLATEVIAMPKVMF